MKSTTHISLVGVILLLLSTNHALAQLDLSDFGKGKKANNAVLTPIGAQPSIWDNLNPFSGRNSVLTFEKPATAVQQFNESTHRALAQTREAIAKPFREVQSIKLWPNNSPAANDRSFSLVPDWLKTQRQPQQPTTIADWLAQPRPE